MKTLLRAVVIGLAAALLAGCQSPPQREVQDEPMRAVRRDDYFVIVRYMDETVLKARYGARYNPFIAFPRAITPSHFLVFRLSLEEVKRPLVLRLDQMGVIFGDRRVPAMDLSGMNKYWEFQDPDTGINGFDRDQRDQILKAEMLANEQPVPAGGRIAKLIVARSNFPRVGEAKLVVPLLDPQGKLVEELEFTFTF